MRHKPTATDVLIGALILGLAGFLSWRAFVRLFPEAPPPPVINGGPIDRAPFTALRDGMSPALVKSIVGVAPDFDLMSVSYTGCIIDGFGWDTPDGEVTVEFFNGAAGCVKLYRPAPGGPVSKRLSDGQKVIMPAWDGRRMRPWRDLTLPPRRAASTNQSGRVK